eukprot:m.343762 g.343762  ORF g.343762 m.343762 type:complete len:95 (-) comp55783_c0_seq2:1593-1877(-)
MRAARLKPHDFHVELKEMKELDGCGQVLPRELRRDAIKVVSSLGQGNFGDVMKGTFSEHPRAPGLFCTTVVDSRNLLAEEIEISLLVVQATLWL